MRAIGIDIGGTSAKLAAIQGDRTLTVRSAEYANPGPAELLRLVRQAAADLRKQSNATEWGAVGLCVPGKLNPGRTRVEYSVNLPSLQQIDLADLAPSERQRGSALFLASDAFAAAFGYWNLHRPGGRLLAISIGTGVGASVLDDGKPVLITGETPGYFGQIEVGEDNGRPVTLEETIGAKGLRARDARFLESMPSWSEQTPPLRGLIRGLRIAHAIYRPDTIALLGYVGMKLASVKTHIERGVNQGLTRVANPNWSLVFGDSPFLAAIGVAQLALTRARPEVSSAPDPRGQ